MHSARPGDLIHRAAEAGAAREEGGSADARRERGVVHTPPALARWAVAQLDECLRDELGRPGGLADPDVALLDPALGAGVWLAAALELAGARRHAPVGCLGLELDPAALAVAAQVLGPAAAQAAWPLGLRCANTLALENPWPDLVATRVVLGNPPWAGRSANREVSLSRRWLEDFRRDHEGRPLGERRVGVLSDDYVRFFRWAAEQVRRGPRGGALCLATNASYLDGPVHRGMRAALLRWFDGVRVLDLGGSALLPHGTCRDDNVFGVRPAAALTLAWVSPTRRERVTVSYVRLLGARADKLRQLARGELPAARLLRPAPPAFRFAPDDGPAYPQGSVSLPEALPFHREGVQTNRDALATAPSREALLGQLRAFVDGTLDAPARAHFDADAARARVAEALAQDPDGRRGVSATPLAYRPWQRRWLAPIAPFCHRPRPALRAALAHASLCLLTARKDRGAQPWHLFGAASELADACFLSSRSSCRTRVFPTHTPDGASNLDAALAGRWAERVEQPIDALAFVHYALAVLAATAFRERFDARLRVDYPCIPPPRGPAHWRRSVAAGRALAAALCEPRAQQAARLTGPVPRPLVGAPRHDPAQGRLWLGEECAVHPVPSGVWEARVGHFRALRGALEPLRAGSAEAPDVLTALGGVWAWCAGLRLADEAYLLES